MAVANLDRCDIAVLHGGFKFAIYQLGRDLVLERSMLEQLRDWWHAYVVKKIEPPLDASEAWGNYLAHKYPFNRGAILKVDENSHPALMRHVFNALNYADGIRDFKAKLTGAQNEVKAFLAESDGIVGPWGKITWRLCKDSTETRINFDKALELLAKMYSIPEIELTRVREQCMESVITKRGGRRFVAKRAKDADSPIPESAEFELT
jgi:predicted phage-related endonuclease